MLPLALVPLLSVVVARCKDGGCKSDDDGKGARVCESGVCNEPCAPGEICRLGKVGRSPLTMTFVCEKRLHAWGCLGYLCPRILIASCT
jgi:hypothetical protein